MAAGKRIVLAARPVGEPNESDFRIEDMPVPTPGLGEMLLRTLWLSLDPYMRGRMSDAPSYATPVGIGQVMEGRTVSEVVASNNDGFAVGDIVFSPNGWQTHAVSDGKLVRKIDPKLAPVSTALGVLGMPGMTAYTGLLDIGRPQPGETVVVSAASGAVGSVVGQIARLKGARAVGIAGGAEKCRYVVEELGFDACIDHRAPDLPARLKAACPKGIDVYFENVGGAVFEAVFPLLNNFARVPVCGQIATYNATEMPAGELRTCRAHARNPHQASDIARLHRLGLRGTPRRFPARCVGVAARRPHQIPRGRGRRPRKSAARADRAAAGREFRQNAGPRRCRIAVMAGRQTVKPDRRCFSKRVAITT